ncbi:MAG: hypothetical protein JXA94_01375 [Parachlamydiales bacterium]|nr:hypothetical protein [Parachlamydiales bacterium]
MIKKKLYLLFIFFALSIFPNEKTVFFKVKNEWELANPKAYTNLIKVGFIKKEKAKFKSSINLACEKTSASLKDYTKAAKEIHEEDINVTYDILDEIQIDKTIANLCQINKKVNGINLKMLQMIFVKDGYVYVMTAACEKTKFLNNFKNFMEIFLSFQLVDNLFDLIEDKDLKNDLLKNYSDTIYLSKNISKKALEKNLTSFEKYLDKKFQNYGKYFQYLLLEKIIKEIK